MRDISLHLLDIVQNSIRAQATLIDVRLVFMADGILHIEVADNGNGMSETFLNNVLSPFVTSRTERRIGLGIPLLKENACLSGGRLEISSTQGKGTTLEVTFNTNHIDCLPIGSIEDTMYSLILMNPISPEFVLRVQSPKGTMNFDTREIRRVVGGLMINEPEIAAWIRKSLNEELTPIMEGIV